MRKVIAVPIVVFALVALVFSGVAMAEGSGCGSAASGSCPVSAKKGEVINKTCPVMGGKINKDTPYKTEYKGKTVGFCCASCIDKFNTDPEAYMAKIEQKCVIKCPRCSAEIDIKEECQKQCK